MFSSIFVFLIFHLTQKWVLRVYFHSSKRPASELIFLLWQINRSQSILIVGKTQFSIDKIGKKSINCKFISAMMRNWLTLKCFRCDPVMIEDERFILGYTKVHLQLVTNWHEAKKLMCKEPILLNFDRNCPEKKFNLRFNEIEKKTFLF